MESSSHSSQPADASVKAAGLALVTGAARRLGRSIALELARMGYAIALHYYTSEAEAQKTAAEASAFGVPVTLLCADLTDERQVREMFARVAGLPNRLRILVNSAGSMKRGDLLTLPMADWDRILDLNLKVPLLCSQLAVPLMTEGGLIVNITDAGAGKAWTGFPGYIVSKAGLEALTRLLARAVAPGIRVNAIAPGLILPSEQINPQDWQRLVGRVPLRRAGSAEEIAQTVAFLIQNEYITGQTIVVDGGYQLV